MGSLAFPDAQHMWQIGTFDEIFQNEVMPGQRTNTKTFSTQ